MFNTNVAAATTTEILRYEYAIKDHLGNARLTFTDKNSNGVVDQTNLGSTNEIIQESHYYPFGLDLPGFWINDGGALDNLYRYNGKELNGDFGLGWMDYGARWYDGSVGRWWSVDPLSNTTPAQANYSYAINSPMRYLDLFGLTAEETNYTYDWNTRQYVNSQGDVVSWSEVSQYLTGSTSLKTYVYNTVSELQDPKILGKSLNYAVDIFRKNGLEDVFNFVFVTDRDMENENMWFLSNGELFIGIVDSPVFVPGVSDLTIFGDIKTKYSVHGGLHTFVNFYHAKYFSPKDPKFALGYLMAHEFLHQILQASTYKLLGDGAATARRAKDGGHTNDLINLNMEGSVLVNPHHAFPQTQSKMLRPSETILSEDRSLILRYLFELSLQKK